MIRPEGRSLRRAVIGVAQAPVPLSPVSVTVPAPVVTAAPLLPAGTAVQLMVVNEVSTKIAKPGDRFLLRVNEPIMANGKIVIPVGTLGYGEVAAAKGNGALGHGGRLAARLLYLEVGGRRLRLRGDATEAGTAGTTANVLGFVMLGWAAPLALLSPGNNAKLKAGQLLTGTLDEAFPGP